MPRKKPMEEKWQDVKSTLEQTELFKIIQEIDDEDKSKTKKNHCVELKAIILDQFYKVFFLGGLAAVDAQVHNRANTLCSELAKLPPVTNSPQELFYNSLKGILSVFGKMTVDCGGSLEQETRKLISDMILAEDISWVNYLTTELPHKGYKPITMQYGKN